MSDKPYRFLNKLGLALALAPDGKSLTYEYVKDEDRQAWTMGGAVGGGIAFESKANGLCFGFEGPPREGAEIVLVDRASAQGWGLKPSNPAANEWKLKLHELGQSWVIEAVSFLQLGLERDTDDANQIWIFKDLNRLTESLSTFEWWSMIEEVTVCIVK
ncbi:hypothetical protein EI94DRAFT_1797526 [Lactarius quietus]|nr:hypothetical protein EI94DRAFT_1797526 [Lactarius quietus]